MFSALADSGSDSGGEGEVVTSKKKDKRRDKKTDADGEWSTVPTKAVRQRPKVPDVPAADLTELKAERCEIRVGEGAICVRLFETDIVVIKRNGDVTLSSGGWKTHRTFQGIQAALRALVPQLTLVSHRAGASDQDWWLNDYSGAHSLFFPGAFALPSLSHAGGFA